MLFGYDKQTDVPFDEPEVPILKISKKGGQPLQLFDPSYWNFGSVQYTRCHQEVNKLLIVGKSSENGNLMAALVSTIAEDSSMSRVDYIATYDTQNSDYVSGIPGGKAGDEDYTNYFFIVRNDYSDSFDLDIVKLNQPQILVSQPSEELDKFEEQSSVTAKFVSTNFKSSIPITAQLEAAVYDPVLSPLGFSTFNDSNIIQKGNYTVDYRNLKGPVFDTLLNKTENDNSIELIPRLLSQSPIQVKYDKFALVAAKGFGVSGRDVSIQYADFVALSEFNETQQVLFGKYDGEIVGNLLIDETMKAIDSSAVVHVGIMTEKNVVFAVFGLADAVDTLKVVTYDFS